MQYDQDGSSEKFKVLTVNFNDAFNIITQLYPNPASNNLNIYYNSERGGTYQLNISDANGTSVYHAQIPSMIGDNKFLLPLSSYANGTYFITLSDPANNKSTVQFVKQD
ncbi:MAG: T9SS type A sorting domain-containing protein [Flavobacteriales bacterium]